MALLPNIFNQSPYKSKLCCLEFQITNHLTTAITYQNPNHLFSYSVPANKKSIHHQVHRPHNPPIQPCSPLLNSSMPSQHRSIAPSRRRQASSPAIFMPFDLTAQAAITMTAAIIAST
jgi:hypothetical protein